MRPDPLVDAQADVLASVARLESRMAPLSFEQRAELNHVIVELGPLLARVADAAVAKAEEPAPKVDEAARRAEQRRVISRAAFRFIGGDKRVQHGRADRLAELLDMYLTRDGYGLVELPPTPADLGEPV